MMKAPQMILKLNRKWFPDSTTKDPTGTANDAKIALQMIPHSPMFPRLHRSDP